jgi:predicted CXXCH cytochrome family protein
MQIKRDLPVQHAPFADGDCFACHDAHGSLQENMLTTAVPGLCAECHDLADPSLRRRHLGFDLTRADCTGCHDPHASATAGLAHGVVHSPFEDGDCTACHAAGGAVQAGGARALCLDCHGGLAADLESGVVHAPLDDDCTVCHSPHSAPRVKLLPAPQTKVCGECHAEQADQLTGSPFRHPDPDGRTCSMCHDPHLVAAADAGTGTGDNLCLACHSYRNHMDHPLGAGTVDVTNDGAPVSCASCHDPHGSTTQLILHDDPRGKLCIRCHTGMIRERR